MRHLLGKILVSINNEHNEVRNKGQTMKQFFFKLKKKSQDKKQALNHIRTVTYFTF